MRAEKYPNTVELKELPQGNEMTFSQEIIVPYEDNWTAADIEKALGVSTTDLNMVGI